MNDQYCSLHLPCHPSVLQVHIYDAVGNYISKMNLYCLDDAAAATQLVGIDWYDGAEGYSDPGQPTLALGMENGRLQLQRHETDDNPVLIDTGMVRRLAPHPHPKPHPSPHPNPVLIDTGMVSRLAPHPHPSLTLALARACVHPDDTCR